jgi:pentose-5-phosphate-3-epimerase
LRNGFITASILFADFARLGEEVNAVLAAGADWNHFDVMDYPDFGGQKFIPEALGKLTEARRRIDATGRDIRREIDCGVKAQNAAEIARAGADTFVSGSAIFGSPDYAATIAALRTMIERGKRASPVPSRGAIR